MIQNESLILLVPGQEFVTLPFFYQPGKNELFLALNNLAIYVEQHYDETGPNQVHLKFQVVGGEVLAAGILSGTGNAELSNYPALPPPKVFKFGLDYTGSIVLELPLTSSDPLATHLRVYRRRGDILSTVVVIALGTAELPVVDARIGDEYFLTSFNPVNQLEGPASGLVRVFNRPGSLPVI